MDICVFLNGIQQPESIATQEEWQALGGWITEAADVTVPLTRIWHLTHLLTYGWTDNLSAMARELRRLRKQQTLPDGVRAVLSKLSQIVHYQPKGTEIIEVAWKKEGQVDASETGFPCPISPLPA